MQVEIITRADFEIFKTEIIMEMRRFLSAHVQPQKKWLKSHEVRKMLGISPGTLQTLRINGTIPYSKIGGVMFYDAIEIQKIIETSRQ